MISRNYITLYFFSGKILEDDKPLSNYKIEEKNFVVVMVTKVGPCQLYEEFVFGVDLVGV